MLSPVVIFVYARPEHTKKTIEAIAKNYLARETEVFIYSDAAKNEKAIQNVKLVREYIDTLIESNFFKSIKLIKAESNKGLASSIITGVSEVIERYGKIIVIEDDLVASPDFLQYMNDALDYYQNDDEIWSISGYTFSIDIPNDYKSDVYLSYRGCSWGWATWKDRWEKVDWNVSDFNHFKVNKKSRQKFNRGGRDMANMLDLQMQGKIDSWAIRWCYTQSKLNMLTVYPIVSRIKNIGLDGSGTHSGVSSRFDSSPIYEYDRMLRFDKPPIDIRIIKSFRDKYGTRYDFFVIGIKGIIKKILRMSKTNF